MNHAHRTKKLDLLGDREKRKTASNLSALEDE
jgi:hypothetical protein